MKTQHPTISKGFQTVRKKSSKHSVSVSILLSYEFSVLLTWNVHKRQPQGCLINEMERSACLVYAYLKNIHTHSALRKKVSLYRLCKRNGNHKWSLKQPLRNYQTYNIIWQKGFLCWRCRYLVLFAASVWIFNYRLPF